MNVSKTNNWVRLGDYIEQTENRNLDLHYGVNDVVGMTITKQIIPTRADVKNTDLSKFLIVAPREFVYNPRTHGKRIGLGYNDKNQNIMISWNNISFKVKDSKLDIDVIPEYLFLIFSRDEWDREACYRSLGSSTEVFSWAEFCRIQIPLPSLATQQQLVDTYNGLKVLAEQNEALIKPLSEACQAYIVDCKKKYPEVELGEYIEEYDKKNTDAINLPFYGINKDKTFMPTVANTNELDSSKYKIVEKDVFVFSGMQTGRDVCIRLALYRNDDKILVSPAYTTFVMKDKSVIFPQYLFLQFNRFQMDRYGWFLSDGSVRSNLDWAEFCRIKIPLPPPDVQQAIVNLYNCAEEARKIASEAREKMKTLCPALVQKAIHQ